MSATPDTSIQQSAGDQSDRDEWVDRIEQAAKPTVEKAPIPKIPRIPQVLKQYTKDFENYFEPRVVSLGPYHHGNEKLKYMENLKPIITNRFFKKTNVKLSEVYDKLYGKIEEVRSCYEENSTSHLSHHKFTTLMLQDGCFILSYIHQFVNWPHIRIENDDLNLIHIKNRASIDHDLFLLENQVPYVVLEELIMWSRTDINWTVTVNKFIKHQIMKPYSTRNKGESKVDKGKSREKGTPAHLLAHTQMSLVGEDRPPIVIFYGYRQWISRYYFSHRTVSELLNAGISFKSSRSNCLTDVSYHPRGFFAELNLPCITIDAMLLNLVAYEMCDDGGMPWVISYVSFLNFLIDHADDVKELRNANILYNSLGSDEEVVKLFKDVCTYLSPNPKAYDETKFMIQRHLENKGKIWVAELKRVYFKSPWSFIALFGAVVALSLAGVQTYFTVYPRRL